MQINLHELTEVTRTKPGMTGENIARFWSRIGGANKRIMEYSESERTHKDH